MPLSIRFLGAARTVTGSKYLLEVGAHRILIDCGLFQGLKPLRLRNWDEFPVPPSEIDVVVLTHAHLDHSGYLPRLAAHGFNGPVFCTGGTRDLCSLVLPDAGRLQEEDADRANRHGYTRHTPALPLYRESDAYRALSLVKVVSYEAPIDIAPGVTIEFINAGHLLGSAYVRMTIDMPGGGRTVLFGGDLGRYGRPVLPDPAPVREADVLLVESTYGDREHGADDGGAALAAMVTETAERGGKLIIPSFAIGRVEEVIYWLDRLEDERRIPVLPVYVDSPMAADALKHYSDRLEELDDEMRRDGGRVCVFCTKRFQTVTSPRHSREVVESKSPSIVISASGMATGGRVLHHLRHGLPNPNNTVLFVGYQAAGTRGRTLVDGIGEVKIHGEIVPVRARVRRLASMSAHADQREILQWLGGFERPPRLTCLVHGEPGPMDTLKGRIEQQLGWSVRTPEYLEAVAI